MHYIKWFDEISMADVSIVGGKNASLGQMIRDLTSQGITIPMGFAITAQAYWYVLKHNNILDQLKSIMNQLIDPGDVILLKKIGSEARSLIENTELPDDLIAEISAAYAELSKKYNQEAVDVAVRSSATAEDLPEASFAGQQDTFLNVQGINELLIAVKKGMASLFTDRAIIYRIQKGFNHFQVALSVGVQKMVRSDLASAGVLFTLDTETGFKEVIMIEAAFGLGETVVKGKVNPDEFRVHKSTLRKGFRSIIKKTLGEKPVKLVYGLQKGEEVQEVTTSQNEYNNFSLADDEVLELARSALIIEDHYSALKGSWMPMDIEWAKDGIDKKIYIVQARPETVHAPKKQRTVLSSYVLKETTYAELAHKVIASGHSIGQQIAVGKARIATTLQELRDFQKGDILVTAMTDPDWVPIMKKAAAIVTDRGGRTSHAAIVSRELGIPAIVGTGHGTSAIKEGNIITIDCSQGATGFVYDGQLKYERIDIDMQTLPKPPVSLMVNVADPSQAIKVSQLPVDGVGLARIEFIISHWIKMHPMAAINPEKVSANIRKELDILSRGYADYKTFFIDTLAQGISTIAAAFYPRPVIVRFSDFKSNEYRNLVGGSYFEPREENPMLGLRGASRYYSSWYEPAFAAECAALKKVRDIMGFHNVKLMIPFVRTVAEAQQVLDRMMQNGLKRNNDLAVYMMCEVPSNVMLIDEFCQYFDGISIGSNDLTQTTLGVDRDSEMLAPLFDERDEAVKLMMQRAIEGAQRNKKHSGICGQAPSDYPEIASFLIDKGIDSLSLNPDSIVPFLLRLRSRDT